jgi:hypothetical protein
MWQFSKFGRDNRKLKDKEMALHLKEFYLN